MAFRLMDLPSIPMAKVLELLSAEQFLHTAETSSKARAVMKSTVPKSHFAMEANFGDIYSAFHFVVGKRKWNLLRGSFEVEVSHRQVDWQPFEMRRMFGQRELAVDSECPSCFKILVSPDIETKIQTFQELIAFIVEAFRIDDLSVNINARKFNATQLESIMKSENLRKANDVKLRGDSISRRLLKEFLESKTEMETFHLQCDLEGDSTIERLPKISYILLENCEWLSSSLFYNLEFATLDIRGNNSITPEDIKMLIRKWLNGINFLYLTLRIQSTDQSKYEEMSKDDEFRRYHDRAPTKHVYEDVGVNIYYTHWDNIDCTNGTHLRRPDGKIASLVLEENHVSFVVWDL